MAYDRVVSDLNAARLRGTSYPIVHALIEASLAVSADVCVSIVSSSLLYNITPVWQPSNDSKFPRPF